jgi:phosphatidylglycerophosphate synthase
LGPADLQKVVSVAFLADLLTFSRLFAAALLLWLGLQGPQTLQAAILTCVAGWTTDQLDGWAARRAHTPTRLAPYDFAIDTTLYAATLAYLVMAGFLPLWPALAFAGVAGVAGILIRRKAVQVLAIRLIDLAAAVVIFTHNLTAGVLLVAWLAVLGVLYRRRLRDRVPNWFAELGRLVSGASGRRGERERTRPD